MTNNDCRNSKLTENGRKRLIFIVFIQSFLEAVTECKKTDSAVSVSA